MPVKFIMEGMELELKETDKDIEALIRITGREFARLSLAAVKPLLMTRLQAAHPGVVSPSAELVFKPPLNESSLLEELLVSSEPATFIAKEESKEEKKEEFKSPGATPSLLDDLPPYYSSRTKVKEKKVIIDPKSIPYLTAGDNGQRYAVLGFDMGETLFMTFRPGFESTITATAREAAIRKFGQIVVAKANGAGTGIVHVELKKYVLQDYQSNPALEKSDLEFARRLEHAPAIGASVHKVAVPGGGYQWKWINRSVNNSFTYHKNPLASACYLFSQYTDALLEARGRPGIYSLGYHLNRCIPADEFKLMAEAATKGITASLAGDEHKASSDNTAYDECYNFLIEEEWNQIRKKSFLEKMEAIQRKLTANLNYIARMDPDPSLGISVSGFEKEFNDILKQATAYNIPLKFDRSELLKGQSILANAAGQGYIKICEAVLAYDPKALEAKYEEGQHPFEKAISGKQWTTAKFIFDKLNPSNKTKHLPKLLDCAEDAIAQSYHQLLECVKDWESAASDKSIILQRIKQITNLLLDVNSFLSTQALSADRDFWDFKKYSAISVPLSITPLALADESWRSLLFFLCSKERGPAQRIDILSKLMQLASAQEKIFEEEKLATGPEANPALIITKDDSDLQLDLLFDSPAASDSRPESKAITASTHEGSLGFLLSGGFSKSELFQAALKTNTLLKYQTYFLPDPETANRASLEHLSQPMTFIFTEVFNSCKLHGNFELFDALMAYEKSLKERKKEPIDLHWTSPPEGKGETKVPDQAQPLLFTQALRSQVGDVAIKIYDSHPELKDLHKNSLQAMVAEPRPGYLPNFALFKILRHLPHAELDEFDILLHAVKAGNEAIVEELAIQGASIRKVGANGKTPLHQLLEFTDENAAHMLEVLVSNHEEKSESLAEIADREGRTFISEVIIQGKAQVLAEFCSQRPHDPSFTDPKKLETLTDLSLKHYFSSKNAFKESEEPEKLHIKNQYEEILRSLSRCSPNYGSTGVFQNLKFIQKILEQHDLSLVKAIVGSDQDKVDPRINMEILAYEAHSKELGESLIKAATAGDLTACQMLVRQGADIRCVDATGKSPLSYSTDNEHWPVVEYLNKELAEFQSKDWNKLLLTLIKKLKKEKPTASWDELNTQAQRLLDAYSPVSPRYQQPKDEITRRIGLLILESPEKEGMYWSACSSLSREGLSQDELMVSKVLSAPEHADQLIRLYRSLDPRVLGNETFCSFVLNHPGEAQDYQDYYLCIHQYAHDFGLESKETETMVEQLLTSNFTAAKNEMIKNYQTDKRLEDAFTLYLKDNTFDEPIYRVNTAAALKLIHLLNRDTPLQGGCFTNVAWAARLLEAHEPELLNAVIRHARTGCSPEVQARIDKYNQERVLMQRQFFEIAARGSVEECQQMLKWNLDRGIKSQLLGTAVEHANWKIAEILHPRYHRHEQTALYLDLVKKLRERVSDKSQVSDIARNIILSFSPHSHHYRERWQHDLWTLILEKPEQADFLASAMQKLVINRLEDAKEVREKVLSQPEKAEFIIVAYQQFMTIVSAPEIAELKLHQQADLRNLVLNSPAEQTTQLVRWYRHIKAFRLPESGEQELLALLGSNPAKVEEFILSDYRNKLGAAFEQVRPLREKIIDFPETAGLYIDAYKKLAASGLAENPKLLATVLAEPGSTDTLLKQMATEIDKIYAQLDDPGSACNFEAITMQLANLLKAPPTLPLLVLNLEVRAFVKAAEIKHASPDQLENLRALLTHTGSSLENNPLFLETALRAPDKLETHIQAISLLQAARVSPATIQAVIREFSDNIDPVIKAASIVAEEKRDSRFFYEALLESRKGIELIPRFKALGWINNPEAGTIVNHDFHSMDTVYLGLFLDAYAILAASQPAPVSLKSTATAAKLLVKKYQGQFPEGSSADPDLWKRILANHERIDELLRENMRLRLGLDTGSETYRKTMKYAEAFHLADVLPLIFMSEENLAQFHRLAETKLFKMDASGNEDLVQAFLNLSPPGKADLFIELATTHFEEEKPKQIVNQVMRLINKYSKFKTTPTPGPGMFHERGYPDAFCKAILNDPFEEKEIINAYHELDTVRTLKTDLLEASILAAPRSARDIIAAFKTLATVGLHTNERFTALALDNARDVQNLIEIFKKFTPERADASLSLLENSCKKLSKTISNRYRYFASLETLDLINKMEKAGLLHPLGVKMKIQEAVANNLPNIKRAELFIEVYAKLKMHRPADTFSSRQEQTERILNKYSGLSSYGHEQAREIADVAVCAAILENPHQETGLVEAYRKRDIEEFTASLREMHPGADQTALVSQVLKLTSEMSLKPEIYKRLLTEFRGQLDLFSQACTIVQEFKIFPHEYCFTNMERMRNLIRLKESSLLQPGDPSIRSLIEMLPTESKADLAGRVEEYLMVAKKLKQSDASMPTHSVASETAEIIHSYSAFLDPPADSASPGSSSSSSYYAFYNPPLPLDWRKAILNSPAMRYSLVKAHEEFKHCGFQDDSKLEAAIRANPDQCRELVAAQRELKAASLTSDELCCALVRSNPAQARQFITLYRNLIALDLPPKDQLDWINKIGETPKLVEEFIAARYREKLGTAYEVKEVREQVWLEPAQIKETIMAYNAVLEEKIIPWPHLLRVVFNRPAESKSAIATFKKMTEKFDPEEHFELFEKLMSKEVVSTPEKVDQTLSAYMQLMAAELQAHDRYYQIQSATLEHPGTANSLIKGMKRLNEEKALENCSAPQDAILKHPEQFRLIIEIARRIQAIGDEASRSELFDFLQYRAQPLMQAAEINLDLAVNVELCNIICSYDATAALTDERIKLYEKIKQTGAPKAEQDELVNKLRHDIEEVRAALDRLQATAPPPGAGHARPSQL